MRFGLAVASAALASCVSAQSQVDRDARCHVNYYDPFEKAGLACGHFIREEDVNGTCGSVNQPCITTMNNVRWGAAECGQCWKVTYNNPLTDGEMCADGGCPQYERSVYIIVADGNTSAVKFEMTQDAWEHLCPYICNFTEDCVTDKAHCKDSNVWADGTYSDLNNPPETWRKPASCAVNYKPMTWERAPECDFGASPPTDPTNAPPAPTQAPTAAPPAPTQAPPAPPAPTAAPPAPTAAPPAPPAPTAAPPAATKPADKPEGEPTTVSGQCNLMQPPHINSCDGDNYEVQYPFVQSCGEAAHNPCMVSGTADECGKCFMLSYTTEDHAADATCKEDCKGYTAFAYVKVVDSSSRADVDMGLSQGVAKQLCPFLCMGEEVCVQDASQCHGSIADAFMGDLLYPGACYKQKFENIKKEPVQCHATFMPMP